MNLLNISTETSIPEGFHWLNEPDSWSLDNGLLTIKPNAETDFYRAPDREMNRDNAPLLYSRLSGDFTIVTHLTAALVGFGDAGALTVRSSAEQWAKLCLERSPAGEFSVVSVVTDGESDDSNGELLSRPECYLRISRKGNVYGMHHSIDGKIWRFTRAFRQDSENEISVGIHAQAPFKGGCSVQFDLLEITSDAVLDFRSGE